MGKFLCDCGYRFSDTVLPNEQLYHMIDSITVWDYPDSIEDKVTELAELWECPDCKSLVRFDNSAYRTCIYKRIDEVEVTAETTKKELLDSLYWMYVQYCSGGHDFMNAGEDASEILENAGYLVVDGAGRILKDNGDSDSQEFRKKVRGAIDA